MPRKITHRYTDPLDLVWLDTARRLGITIQRSQSVFASWDGQGVLTLSTPENLDPDDSLAQLIFHEICHALVEGPEAMKQADWGLENQDASDLVREHACHRLQAALADPYDLRMFLAVTTDHRNYYDNLGALPLADCSDPAAVLARAGWLRSQEPPYSPAIQEALAATADLLEITRPFASQDSLWRL
ncbi:MAG: hypothetical protein VX519_10735 [Myxococcota bacterium]|nr:hypothetical protein [Myxococcota bacterium]